jgi:STE24 endopeptidase
MKAIRSATATAAAAAMIALSLAGGAHAQAASAAVTPVGTSAPASSFHIRPVDDAWRTHLPRDAEAATQAYLDRLPADVVARSNAYFEGGYWLQLWNFLLGLVVSWLLLRRRISARVRDACQRLGRFGLVRDALYGAFYAVASWVLTLPLAVYQGYFREHQYQMATQTFGPWFVDQLKTLGAQTVAFALGLACLYLVIRRTGERWWLWGTGATMAMMVVAVMIAPVWLDPLFNTYKPVTDPVVKAAVLAMARADDVPVDDVYEFDASLQTTRVSANVSGIFGTAAVRLNDNLMRTSLPEIRAVMGHELGHFVMNHIYKGLCEMAILTFAGFVFSKWALDGLLRRHGSAWGLRGAADVASFPLFIAVFSTFMFLTTPISNTMVRTQEIEADRFGLNLAREPHGEAEVDLKLTEYRKPDPGPLEEFVFFDHPSTRHRIMDAMRWRQAMGTP